MAPKGPQGNGESGGHLCAGSQVQRPLPLRFRRGPQKRVALLGKCNNPYRCAFEGI
jgi:hypothetical protein